jgi:8-amino-7-oxononanoate synthase
MRSSRRWASLPPERVNRLAQRMAEGLATMERERLLRTRRVLDSAQGARACVAGRTLANFSSNDYLGLANHPSLRAAADRATQSFGVGAGASPLVSGHMRLHEEAEARFAAFTGHERALLFGSGYAANLGILAALCDRQAEVFGDRLDHACLIDGALLSRAKYTRYPHGDGAALEARLAASSAVIKVVATDAVFSMDGDVAPLAALLASCERHDAWLLVDDAHGIGVLGQGRGTLHELGLRSDRIVYMATLGKALGGYGAFACGSALVVEWLMQRARTYMYSTALPPACAATAIAALETIEAPASPVPTLRRRIAGFRRACGDAGVKLMESSTAIQPVVVGDAAAALAISEHLLERGFLVPAIRPPTVPQGGARLRISLSAAHSESDVESLARALAECMPR